MPALRDDIDPDGLLEYSVVFSDRSLNSMSDAFGEVMRDISRIMRNSYGAASVAVVPGGGTYGMEAIARHFANDARVLVIRNGWFSYRWSQIMDAGDLVSDEIILGIVEERLAHPDTEKGFLLDGFPRTDMQAQALTEMLAPVGIEVAIDIEVPDDVVTQRMLARGRDDDSPEAIKRRLELYQAETAPLLDFYSSRGILLSVDGLGTEKEVQDRIVDAIESRR